jgi:hypothetical protein
MNLGVKLKSCDPYFLHRYPTMRLKIFSDKSFLPAGMEHVAMLYPFWGKNPEDPQDPSSGRYDRYVELGRDFFTMTPVLEEADLAVLPASWERVCQDPRARDLAGRFAEQVRRTGKRLVVFYWSDAYDVVPLENASVFRTSFHRSTRKPHEFAMPAWSEDLVEKYLDGRLPLRDKQENPVVGFCGYGRIRWDLKNILSWGASRLGLKQTDPFVGHCLRAKGLRLLANSPRIETNFVIRDSFWGGALPPRGTLKPSVMQQLRQEFVHNLVNSDYILCVRGNGNFSYRLYETLSCGRIPVFIDTDCVLPYDFAIDWKQFCVWIDRSEVSRIAEKVNEFHHKLSPQDFRDLQVTCRQLWETWLSPEGFFHNFHRHFQPGEKYR